MKSRCFYFAASVFIVLSVSLLVAGCAERGPKTEEDGKTRYDNPIDEYFLPKINHADASQAEIRAYQDDYKNVWKDEFENLTKWLGKKCIYEEDRKKIQEMKKSVLEYAEKSKEVILTELLDTYKVNPDPGKGEETRNSYQGNGTRSRLNQIEGEIYRDASMRMIRLYGEGAQYEFRKIDYSVSRE